MINNNRPPEEGKTDTALSVTASTALNTNVQKYTNYKEAFNYYNINRCVHRKLFLEYLDEYEAYNIPLATGKYFIHLTRKKAGQYETTQNERGFKFHISIEHSDLEKGWEIIITHLINHEVFLSKIIFVDALPLMAASRNQCGKEITIYAYREDRPAPAWQRLIENITHDLVKNQIKPGPLPPSDIEIPGSNYFSYRNDRFRKESNNQLNDAQEDWFSDYELVEDDSHSDSDERSIIDNVIIDPFAQIEINIPDQSPRPEFSKNIVLVNFTPTVQQEQPSRDEKLTTELNENKNELDQKDTHPTAISNDRFIDTLLMFSPQSSKNNAVSNFEIREEPSDKNELKKCCHCVIQ
jgi:Salmonella virulence-associated 28kDa protein